MGAQHLIAVNGPLFRKADQPSTGVDFHNHLVPYGPVTIARSVLLEMLQTRLSDLCTIYKSTNVTNYEEKPDGTLMINLRDGSARTADVLIGCDGVHSTTRAALFANLAKSDPSQGYEKFSEPRWCGTLVFRGVVGRNELREKSPGNVALDLPRIWCGKTKHVVTHPFGDNIAVVCFHNEEGGYGKPFINTWMEEVPSEEVIHCYSGWEPDLLEVVGMIQKPSRWAIHVVDDLPLSVSGRIGLLGDAAHAMTPHQGVGGGQAIEASVNDAHILGRLLAHDKTNLSNLSKVLQIYQDIRLPQAQAASRRAWSNGLMYDFKHPDFSISSAATAEELKRLGQAVSDSFEWLGKGGCDEDWKRAEASIVAI
ncbi:hypothetical protein H0H87_003444 [Tephrocybe sp. NHM501043]|nr:hypothetical protein H0H87_003444 [Tephrocybe sp. NHM501043]